MTPFKLILAATDFSVPADNAVQRAALLAKQHGCRLRIVHVINPPRPSRRLLGWGASATDLDVATADARTRLQRLATQLTGRYDVTAELEVRTGDTLEELHRCAARADLLVMGQRRRHPLAEMLAGRTAQRLVEHSRRPVLVVKQLAEAGYRRVLLPIDFSPASDAAACVAAALAPAINLQVFHAVDSIGAALMRRADVDASIIRDYRNREDAALMARMRRSMARLGLGNAKLSFALGRGSPTAATLRQAQDMGADVLVATKHTRTRFASDMLGSLNGLLARSNCDVLIVAGWVRDVRRLQTSPRQWPAARAAGFACPTPVRAQAAQGSSWMQAQLPAAAFMAGQQGLPRRAGG